METREGGKEENIKRNTFSRRKIIISSYFSLPMEKLSKNNRNSLILTQHLLIFIYLKYKISCKWFFKDHFFHSKFDGGGEKRNSGLICYYKKCSLKTHQHKIWYFKYTKQNIFSVKIKLFIIFLLKFLHGIKRRRKRRGYKKKIRFHEEKGEKRNSGLIFYYKKCSLKSHQHEIWYFKYTKQNIFLVKISLFIIFLLKFLHGNKRRRKRRGYKKKYVFTKKNYYFLLTPNPFSLPMEKLSKNNMNNLIFN